MNLSEPFIKRPVMTTLVMATILFFGIIAYQKLPVSDLPNVDFPTIQVTVSNPGSNPETMANTCATPLEKEFMTIDGLDTITSNSVTGQSTLLLQFTLDKNLDSAALDVQAAINRAQPNLPNDLPYNPTYEKVNPAATPILYIALTSDSMTQYELFDYGNTYVGQRLSMTEGVSAVVTYGSAYAARIQINPETIAALNVGFEDVTDSLTRSNVDLPTGTLYGDKNEFTIDVDGQLKKALGYKEVVIRSENGELVKIKDTGRALDGLQKDKLYLNFFSKSKSSSCVVLAVQRQSGANTVKIIDTIDNLLPNIQKTLPPSLKFHRIFDKKESIIESVNDVKMTLIIAFFLVVFIIYISLGKIYNTVIPTLALPLSILGTFSIMYLLNYSIDILSLLALTLSIGFLVDDAIVVLENNVRHVQLGEKPFEASIKGSKEIGITIVSMSICLISVFIPLLFLGGIVGRLFREFAVTIAVAVFISGFISLTLTPLLSSRFIPPYSEEKKGKMEKFADFINDKMRNFYDKTLTFLFNQRWIVLLAGAVCLTGSILLFLYLPKDFLPPDDEGFIQGYTQAADGTSPFQMTRYQKEVSDILMQDEAVEYLVSVSSFSNDNEGVMFIKLKPYHERKPIQEIINRMMVQTAPLAGLNTFLSSPPLINLQVGTQAKALYQYSLTALNQSVLNQYATEFESQMRTLPGLTQIYNDLQIEQPQLNLSIDRDRASDLNVSARAIETMLSHAYTGKRISTIKTSINQYDVILETLPEYYKNPNSLEKLYVKSNEDKVVPLSEIVQMEQTVGPLSINHLNGLPSASISFNLENLSLGEAVDSLDSLAQKILPPNVSGSAIGTADVFKKSFANLTFLLILTFFVIYIILGILYENFIHPLTVMSTLPPATFGGLISLYLVNATLSIYSFVGIVMLIGIVMKNGIMMVDFANEFKIKEKISAKEAIHHACLVRFRPIMMTTFAALMGAVPIALGIGGASAQTRRPLGIAIVGGLIISQILTLYLTPITYYYMEFLQTGLTKLKNKIYKKNLT